jgi:large subunit ribosomal protein L11
MAKEIEGTLKLQVPAGQANPSPPVGPALGQRGINIMDFCKMFNDKSKNEQPGVMLPVVVTYFTDKSFTMDIKLPPASFFIKEALKIKKGSKEPGRDIIKTITIKQCEEIASKKLKDFLLFWTFLICLITNVKLISLALCYLFFLVNLLKRVLHWI